MSIFPEEPIPDLARVAEIALRACPSLPTRVERVMEGGSTYVYRIVTERACFYLRILPEVGASFSPEVEVHRRLRQIGVKVPEVVYFERDNALVRRSIMVTTEISGEPVGLSLSFADLEKIVVEAGQDVARIQTIPVDGFGWIDRGGGESGPLRAEWPTYRAFALESWEADLAYLGKDVLTPFELMALERAVAQHEPWLEVESGQLAHGDFDLTHIFHDGGRYTGIIDFGEIRGADRWYDLGHFHLRDGERLPTRLGPMLVRGYEQVDSLPPDYLDRIRFSSLLINVRALARSLRKNPPNRYTQHQVAVLREDLLAFE